MNCKIQIRLAPNSGFCFGVKRAISMAEDASDDGERIVTLGPLIHNPQVVQRFRKKNVVDVDSVDEIFSETVIIRSHGIEREILRKLQKKNVKIIDATCPYVAKAQELAHLLSEKGYLVIIMGDKEHPEVKAICSNIKGEFLILCKDDNFPPLNHKKLGLISQTTKSLKDFQTLAARLIPLSKELRVINTICSATNIRQQATLTLARDSQIMIVIGGFNSSNTKMLAKICKNIIETQHIETEDELKSEWFDGKTKIGITAGASTPDWIIVNVYNKINKCTGSNCPVAASIEDIPGYKE